MYILAAYSYRGGTGRSSLATGISVHAASLGQRVLLVDADMTAPGLHRYMGIEARECKMGLREFLNALWIGEEDAAQEILKRALLSPRWERGPEVDTSVEDQNADRPEGWWRSLISEQISDKLLSELKARVRLLPAGNLIPEQDKRESEARTPESPPAQGPTAEYLTRSEEQRWVIPMKEGEHDGHVHPRIRQLLEEAEDPKDPFDLVVIDLPPGFNQGRAGVTLHVADALLALSPLNGQGIEGLFTFLSSLGPFLGARREYARTLHDDFKEVPPLGPLTLVPIAARVDDTGAQTPQWLDALREEWQRLEKRLGNQLEHDFCRVLWPTAPDSRRKIFQLHYHPQLAFGEQIAPLCLPDSQPAQAVAAILDQLDLGGRGRHAPDRISLTKGDFEWIRIPDGPFFAGDQLIRQSLGSPFYLQRYPITRSQYRQFIEADGYQDRGLWSDEDWALFQAWRRRSPSSWEDIDKILRREQDERVAVSGITFAEARAYVEWLNRRLPSPVRLPTPKEWEKAARGEDGRLYPWGSRFEPHRCDWGRPERRHPAPRVAPGSASQDGDCYYGTKQMVGTVREWTQLPSGYPGPAMGGSWRSEEEVDLTCFSSQAPPSLHREILPMVRDFGIRLAMDVEVE